MTGKIARLADDAATLAGEEAMHRSLLVQQEWKPARA
jgi:hypothetical protein